VNYIDVTIGRGLGKKWHLTRMYGEQKWESKPKTWQRLRDLHAECDMPWLVLGDLNEGRHSSDQFGVSLTSSYNIIRSFEIVLLSVFYQNVNDRWEVCVSLSDALFRWEMCNFFLL
jgi:hypothetical protein